MTYDDALKTTLGFEGGLEDDARDHGGRTNYGITQTEYDNWRARHAQAKRPVDLIEDQEIHDLYLEDYWTPCGCDILPPALAFAVFDMAVNSGTWNAKLTLQRALGVKTDGVIGPLTAAAASADPDIVLKYLKYRAGFITELITVRPGQSAFLHGWINRLLDQAWSRQ